MAYDARVADLYDALYEKTLDTSGAVTCLARLAGPGPVLELGVGTGRIALPLSAAGVEVHGIDNSPAMLDKLRNKPGADAVTLFEGDMTRLPMQGTYSLVYAAFNSLFALPSQEAQIECFASVASRLSPGGHFVVEGFVLGNPGQKNKLALGFVDPNLVVVDATAIDAVQQRVTVQHILLGDGRVQLYPFQHRYAWPAELDLMARLTGLQLHARWQDWTGAPIHSASEVAISVYTRVLA